MVKDSPERNITAGGVKLMAFIRASGLSIPAFCEKHGLDRIGVQRIVNGERWRRVSLDLALALSKATGGEVPVESFSSKTARRPKGTRAA